MAATVKLPSVDFKFTTSNSWFSISFVISKLLSGKTYRNHKLWNIASTVTYISHTYYKVIQWYKAN